MMMMMMTTTTQTSIDAQLDVRGIRVYVDVPHTGFLMIMTMTMIVMTSNEENGTHRHAAGHDE